LGGKHFSQLTSDNTFHKVIGMKKSAKKHGKGQPKKAKHMKAIVIAVSLKPEHEKKLREIMKATGLDRSKAVQWLIENWQR